MPYREVIGSTHRTGDQRALCVRVTAQLLDDRTSQLPCPLLARSLNGC